MTINKDSLSCVKDKAIKIVAGALVATVVVGATSVLEVREVDAMDIAPKKNVVVENSIELMGRYSHIEIDSVTEYEDHFGVKVAGPTLSGSFSPGFEVETEQKEYFKDGALHDALTKDSAAELALYVTGYCDENGDLYFKDVTPSILMAQQCAESDLILDATSGKNGSGSQVGIAQISCKWTVDKVNKWVHIVDESPIETKEEARELLLNYPVLSAFVQADLLQSYMDSCPEIYAEDREAYALDAYRWGAGDVSNHDRSYSEHVREVENELSEKYFEGVEMENDR